MIAPHTLSLALLCALGLPASAGELTPEQKAELAAAFERAVGCDGEARWSAICERKAAGEPAACEKSGECGLACDCAPPAQLLAMALVKNEYGWNVVAPLVRAGFAAEATSDAAKTRMLDLLALARSERADGLAAELWQSDAQRFTLDHLLVFAESKGYGAKSKGAYGADHDAAKVGPYHDALTRRAQQEVRAAAYAALMGDEQAAQTLRKVAAAQSFEAGAGDALVAAQVLAKLGDEQPWIQARQRVRDAVITALDAGNVEHARRLALEAEFFHAVFEGKQPAGLGFLDHKLAYHRALRGPELASADQVFELIESITPL